MKKIFFFLSVFASVILASCSKTLPNPNEITVNPNPLEVVADKIDVEITGTFPAKEFAKKGVLEIIPVLKYNGKEVLGKSVVYVGEKSKENGIKVNFKNGGSYKQSATFKYVPEMDKSELYLRFKARNGKKEIVKEDIKIADGVISTIKLLSVEDNKPILSKDKFQRVIQEMKEADIKFLIQQSNLRESEIKSQEVQNLQAAIKEAYEAKRKKIKKLEVSGYASPEGGLDLNTRLAKERQKNAQTFLEKQMKKDNVTSEILTNVTAEDWAGFKKAMEKSNIQDKSLVLRVLSMYEDPEERETQIKNLSNVYKTIADEILPELRRSKLVLTTNIIGKSDKEILKMIKSKSDIEKLSIEELLYGANLLKTRKQKIPVYQKAATKFKDYRAYNNLGVMYFKGKNYKEAARFYGMALQITPNDKDINFNAALVAVAQNDLAKAEEYIGKAAGTKGNLNAIRGMISAIKGDYKAAQKAYGNTASNNATIVQILNGDYATARKTLKSIKKPDATTSYLKAIVAARTNDRKNVCPNLKKALKDKNLRKRVEKDIEFAKFANDDEFKKVLASTQATSKSKTSKGKSTDATTKQGGTKKSTGTTTPKSGATTQKTGTPTQKTGATTQKSGTPTSKSGTTTQKTGTPTQKTGATTQKSGTTTQKAGTTTQKTGTTQKSGTTTQKTGATTQKSGTTAQKSGATTQKQGTNTKTKSTTSKK